MLPQCLVNYQLKLIDFVVNKTTEAGCEWLRLISHRALISLRLMLRATFCPSPSDFR
jgi:hypothetical protein